MAEEETHFQFQKKAGGGGRLGSWYFERRQFRSGFFREGKASAGNDEIRSVDLSSEVAGDHHGEQTLDLGLALRVAVVVVASP